VSKLNSTARELKMYAVTCTSGFFAGIIFKLLLVFMVSITQFEFELGAEASLSTNEYDAGCTDLFYQELAENPEKGAQKFVKYGKTLLQRFYDRNYAGKAELPYRLQHLSTKKEDDNSGWLTDAEKKKNEALRQERNKWLKEKPANERRINDTFNSKLLFLVC